MHTYLSGRVRQSRADKDELWRQNTLNLEVRACVCRRLDWQRVGDGQGLASWDGVSTRTLSKGQGSAALQDILPQPGRANVFVAVSQVQQGPADGARSQEDGAL